MKPLAVAFWLACGWQSCEVIYAAGGWELFWILFAWRFGGEVLAKVGVWLWKGRIA